MKTLTLKNVLDIRHKQGKSCHFSDQMDAYNTLVNDIGINFWLANMMYCDYCIGTNKPSLTVQSDLNFQVV